MILTEIEASVCQQSCYYCPNDIAVIVLFLVIWIFSLTWGSLEESNGLPSYLGTGNPIAMKRKSWWTRSSLSLLIWTSSVCLAMATSLSYRSGATKNRPFPKLISGFSNKLFKIGRRLRSAFSIPNQLKLYTHTEMYEVNCHAFYRPLLTFNYQQGPWELHWRHTDTFFCMSRCLVQNSRLVLLTLKALSALISIEPPMLKQVFLLVLHEADLLLLLFMCLSNTWHLRTLNKRRWWQLNWSDKLILDWLWR